MKKLLAIFAFLAVTLSVSAQEKKVNFQAIAKEKTHTLTKELALTGDKQRTVYNAFMMSERKKAALTSNQNAKVSAAAIENINNELYSKLASVLSKEQINKAKAILKKGTPLTKK